MDISNFVTPIIGAIIGYSTNWLAIKMMFNPKKTIKILGIRVPFTPGIIPKNRENIAYAISNTITRKLITGEDIRAFLISENIMDKLEGNINLIIENNSIRDLSTKVIDSEEFEKIISKIKERIVIEVFNNINEYKIGKIIADKISESIQEKIGNSVFGLFGANKIINSISENIENNISEYINENGKEVIDSIIEKELKKYTEINISEFITDREKITNLIKKIYINIITEKSEEIIKKLNIGKIIEDKINSMDINELEKLILEIMKKELNAVVNLGALLGFLMGTLNLLF